MAHTKPNVSIRFGASSDDIAVDGKTFTRHKLTRSEQGFLRGVIIGALTKADYFSKEAR